MRKKVILVLVLLCAVFASLTVGTLSSYTAASGSSISISPDSDKIRKQAKIREMEEVPPVSQEPSSMTKDTPQ